MSMSVASMTGFSRAEADFADWRIVWELRSVNGKGLDLRIRLPQGLDALEPEVRKRISALLSRGNVQINLQVQRSASVRQWALNRDVLAAYVEEARRLVEAGDAALPTADGLLALRGVFDIAEETPLDVEPEFLAQLLMVFDTALEQLIAARLAEGVRIAEVLRLRLDELQQLAEAANADPSRQPEAIKARLAEQIALIAAADATPDTARLAQEVALLATRADIREELDRLHAHIAAGRALLKEGGAVGRRLDFLSQEFNRESNTLCAKSNATSLTAIGLQMKVVVDQFREQVQNIE